MDHFLEAPPLVREFLIYTESIQGKSKSTAQEYFFDLRTFFRFLKKSRGLAKNVEFDQIPIDDVDLSLIRSITLMDIYEYMNFSNQELGNNSRTRARKTASLRSFFKYLHAKAKLIDHNPTENLDSPKLKKSLPVHLSVEESRRLLASVDGKNKERDFAILILFLNCGLRLSELVGLDLGDIRGDTAVVTGKGNKERTIYLNDACIEGIENYKKVRPADGVKDKKALFLSGQKRRISVKTVQWLVKKYLQSAGLDAVKYSTHKLRHTAATLMYQHGKVDIRSLQAILGHEQLSTTEIYTHIDDQLLRQAAKSNPLADARMEGKKKEQKTDE